MWEKNRLGNKVGVNHYNTRRRQSQTTKMIEHSSMISLLFLNKKGSSQSEMKTDLMMRIKSKGSVEASIGLFGSVCLQENDAKLKCKQINAAGKERCKVPISIGTMVISLKPLQVC